MGEADYLALGDWNATCSLCGAKRKASTLVKNWQGWYRCPSHNEPRQPQDFVRGVVDVQAVPWTQPETWTLVPGAPNPQASGIVGIGIVGAMIVGYVTPYPVIYNPPN